jgi:hypothetical protein
MQVSKSLLLAVLGMALAGCATESQPLVNTVSDPTATTPAVTEPTPTPTPPLDMATAPQTSVPNTPPPSVVEPKPWSPPGGNAPVATSSKYPKGFPVPGKKGFVKSPYAEYAGLVDVQGFPPGTEVKCPYTQKIFIVP